MKTTERQQAANIERHWSDTVRKVGNPLNSQGVKGNKGSSLLCQRITNVSAYIQPV